MVVEAVEEVEVVEATLMVVEGADCTGNTLFESIISIFPPNTKNMPCGDEGRQKCGDEGRGRMTRWWSLVHRRGYNANPSSCVDLLLLRMDGHFFCQNCICIWDQPHGDLRDKLRPRF